MSDQISFPIRINRYLSLKGFATRKGADELVEKGSVTINGAIAKLGDKVTARDIVEVVRGNLPPQKFVYLAYYKPRGIITHSPKKHERAIKDLVSIPGVFPIGRLDKDSEGLIILTNDGRITERLLHPRFVHEKEYAVLVNEPIPSGAKKSLESGMRDKGELLTAEEVRISGPNYLTITLTEGKKHQIRRMLAKLGLTVTHLKRTRIMNIHLGGLKPGEQRVLTGKARQSFLADLGLA